jgi:hypothetical protein
MGDRLEGVEPLQDVIGIVDRVGCAHSSADAVVVNIEVTFRFY